MIDVRAARRRTRERAGAPVIDHKQQVACVHDTIASWRSDVSGTWIHNWTSAWPEAAGELKGAADHGGAGIGLTGGPADFIDAAR